MNWLSKGPPDSACARILAVYILMLIGGVVGLLIGGVVGWGPSLFAFPFVTVLMGPFVIGVWIGMLLFGPGSAMLGLMLLLVLSVVQYMLLIVAFRRIICKKRWMWGIYLFAYSVTLAYVFPIVTYIT